MSNAPAVELRGRLICGSAEEAAVVETLLPEHIERTRAEAGCLSFDVLRTDDPLVWSVSETFVDKVAFTAHQARVGASEWGRATSGVERDYTIGPVAS